MMAVLDHLFNKTIVLLAGAVVVLKVSMNVEKTYPCSPRLSTNVGKTSFNFFGSKTWGKLYATYISINKFKKE